MGVSGRLRRGVAHIWLAQTDKVEAGVTQTSDESVEGVAIVQTRGHLTRPRLGGAPHDRLVGRGRAVDPVRGSVPGRVLSHPQVDRRPRLDCVMTFGSRGAG